LTGSALSARIADEVGAFLLHDLRMDGGLFAVALDADADGVEGLTYRWTVEELRDALPPSDAAVALQLFGLGGAPDDPEGEVLRLVEDPVDPILFASVRGRLRGIRDRRPQPGRDNIAVLRDNALAITALAEAGAALGRVEWVDAAMTASDELFAAHRVGDDWRHSSFHGVAGPSPATLADVACLATALMAVYQAGADPDRLQAATSLLDDLLAGHRADDGGWFDGAVAEASVGPMIVRPRDPADGAAPSGASAVTEALVTAFGLTGRDEFRMAAEDSLAAVAAVILRFPRSGGWHLAAAEALMAGPLQIALSVRGGGPGALGAPDGTDEMVEVARRLMPGGAVVDVGLPDAPGRPLLADRPLIEGRTTAYVCRGFVCDRPVNDPDLLAAALRL
jgi:uncharacterized protein YyaL (SSP411 family)